MMGRIGGVWALALVALVCACDGAAAAPAWLPQQASFGDTEGLLATATMTPDGTVVTARLSALAPGEYAVEARSRPPGGSFGAIETIDRPVQASAPVLVPGRDGTVALVYVNNGTGASWASIRPPGGAFGPPRLLTSAAGGPTPEKLAFDDGGRLWLVHPQGSSIVASVLPPSGPVADLVVDTAAASVSPLSPSIGISPAGEIRVAYLFNTLANLAGPVCTLDSELREADGGIGGFSDRALLATASAVGSGTPCFVSAGTIIEAPRLATTSDGATTVVYSTGPFGTSTRTVAARYRPAGGAWPPPTSAAEAIATTAVPEPLVVGAGATPFVAIDSTVSPTSIAVTRRTPAGTWTAPQTVTGAAGGFTPRLAAAPSGATVLAWKQGVAPFRIQAVTGSPSGEVSPAAFVSDVQDAFASLGGVGIDDDGNAVVGWNTHLGSVTTVGRRAMVAGYDGAGPRFTALSVPADGLAGASLGFSASAVDVWSPVGPPSWQFGDGGSANGGAVSHSFGPGSYTVSAAVTDALGNTTGASRPVVVSAGPDPGPAAATVGAGAVGKDTTKQIGRPTLTKVMLKPKKARRGKAVRLSFELSEAATVRVTIARAAKGMKRGRRCVKAPPKARRKAKSCRRFVTVKVLRGKFGAGAASLALPKTLAVGAYRVTALAIGPAGNASSPPAAATLTVVPAPRH